MKNPLAIITFLLFSILFYYSYQYYTDVELVEMKVGECKLDRIRGTALSNINYIIYYQDKIYDREYKALGFSNLLWSDDDFYNNMYPQKDNIYFYRLKSEKDIKKTSHYFLPSAKKPITNKVFLILDIWGYFMTNWFWRILFSLGSVVVIGELTKSEKDRKISRKVKSNNVFHTNGLLDKIDTFLFKILAIIYIVLVLSLFFY